jgi:hypothetical protein
LINKKNFYIFYKIKGVKVKKLFIAIFILFISSVIFISCSDNPVGGSGSPGTITHTYTKTTPPVTINNGSTNDFVNVPDTGNVSSMIYSLDSILGVDVTKIDIILMHNNIYDTLIHNLTNPGNNFIGTKFSDQSADSIKNGSGNYTGTFRPYRPLSVFNGQSIIGQWFLYVNYWGTMKSGVIKSWGITITYNKLTAPSGAIVPLAVNNQWIYEIDTGSSFFRQDTISISGSSVVHGKQVYWWWYQWGGNNPTSIMYVRDESDGMWQYGNPVDTTSSTWLPHLLIKYPINLNETYYTNNWISTYDTMTCTSTNATFAGYSGCIRYYEPNTFKKDKDNIFYHNFINNYSPDYVVNINSYFKPGIGLVGMEQTANVSGYSLNVTYKLIKYTLH